MCVSIFIDNTISFIINFAVWVKQGAQEISYFDTALIFGVFHITTHIQKDMILMFGAISFAAFRQLVMRNNCASVFNSCKQFIDHVQEIQPRIYEAYEEKSLHLSSIARMLCYLFYRNFVRQRKHCERTPSLALAQKYLLMFNYVDATIITSGLEHIVEKLEGS